MASRSKYIPGLDGLRAFAVFAVVVYHMSQLALPSGLLGVTIFFVLSGYLITGLLIREWNSTGKIDLPRFWMHRVRRLFPAIVFMICTVLVITAFVAPALLTKLRNDLFAALFWFTNWWYIFQDVSYFEQMGAPSPVTHFWSLAIEEQFYLVWPPVLLLLFKSKIKKGPMEAITLGLALVSVILMMVLFIPDSDPSRVYYGTDTRAFSLLIGAFLAFAFPVHRIQGRGRNGLKPPQRRLLGYLGIAAFAAIIVMMFVVNAYSPFMYYGGILLVSLLTGIMILALVDPKNLLSKIFSLGPIVYIGKISYGIYIWHYPILLLMTDFNSTVETPWYWYLLQAVVILAVSSFSYFVVEQPIRHGCLGRFYHEVKEKSTTWGEVVKTHIVYVALTVMLVLGATVACIVVPYTTTQQNTSMGEGSVVPESAFSNDSISDQTESAPEIPAEKSELLSQLGSNPALPYLSDKTLRQLVDTPGSTPREKAGNTQFLLIGDSVTATFAYEEEGYGHFHQLFPNAILDSVMNRTAAVGEGLYLDYAAQGWDGPVVIFELGTNVTANTENYETMLNAVPDNKMIFIPSIRTTDPNEKANNELIERIVAGHDNVEMIDWYSATAGHSEYFDGDGTHPTPTGCDVYQQLIMDALESLYK